MPAVAGHFEDGYRAYNKADYPEALAQWSAGDADGDPESTYELSIMYRDGEGVAVDAAKSLILISKAAGQGYVPAQYNLAEYYRQGKGVEADPIAARQWFLTAAKKFSVGAMHGYATALHEGLGGSKDQRGAIFWYERAKDHEDPDRYYDQLIETGKLPKPDHKARFKERLSAAKAGDADAQFAVAMMYLNGKGTKQDFDAMERWFLAAAEQGHSMAQLRMGNLYKDGLIRTRDEKKAGHWLHLAALQDNAFAQAILGLRYMLGMDGKKDRALGLAMLKVAVHNGDWTAVRMRVEFGLQSSDDEVETANAMAATCLASGMAACLK